MYIYTKHESLLLSSLPFVWFQNTSELHIYTINFNYAGDSYMTAKYQ